MNPNTTRFLNRIHGFIAGSFGFVANIILIFFILRSKRKEFRKVFLQVAIIDIIFLLVTAAAEPGSTVITVVFVYVMSSISSTYIIIIFCVITIRATLKNVQATMSKETRQLQSPLSWTFGMQALCPLFVSFGPLTCLAYTIITEGTAFWSMIWLTTGFAWVPFTNATITLCFVSEFRQKIMFIRKYNSSVASSNTATMGCETP